MSAFKNKTSDYINFKLKCIFMHFMAQFNSKKIEAQS